MLTAPHNQAKTSAVTRKLLSEINKDVSLTYEKCNITYKFIATVAVAMLVRVSVRHNKR